MHLDKSRWMVRRTRLGGEREGSQPNTVRASRREMLVSSSRRGLFIEGAGQRPRPAERAGKREPSSSPKAMTSIAKGKRFAGFERGLHHFDGGDDPERAIEAAGVSHAVDMRADHQRARCRRRGLHSGRPRSPADRCGPTSPRRASNRRRGRWPGGGRGRDKAGSDPPGSSLRAASSMSRFEIGSPNARWSATFSSHNSLEFCALMEASRRGVNCTL